MGHTLPGGGKAMGVYLSDVQRVRVKGGDTTGLRGEGGGLALRGVRFLSSSERQWVSNGYRL